MKPAETKCTRRKWPWLTLAALLIVLLAGLELLPYLLPYISPPELEIDLSDRLTKEAASLVTNRTLTARSAFARTSRGEILITTHGRALDWPYTLRVWTDFSPLSLSVSGNFTFEIDDTNWRANGRFQATPRTWQATAQLPGCSFDEHDAVLASVLPRLLPASIANLACSGTVQLSLSAEKTRELPVTVWTAQGRLSHAAVSCVSNGRPIELNSLAVGFGASAIADRVTVHPVSVRAVKLDAAGFSLANLYANLRMTENGFLVTEAGSDLCGGEVRLYSLYLNPKNMTGGVTLFLDNIDADEALRHLSGFRGTASGRLHGKLPLTLRNGEKLRLKNAYLYSTPGESGTLKLSDPDPIVQNLQLGGVDDETCANLSKALADLVYDVLKLDLKREDDGGLALTLRIEGSARHAGVTVPVSFEVTFHGDLEQLINTGLKIAR